MKSLTKSQIEKITRGYKVIIWNDDRHSFPYVTFILEFVFKKSYEDAQALAMEIHNNDYVVVERCSLERAELYVAQVLNSPEIRNGSVMGPLEITIEKV